MKTVFLSVAAALTATWILTQISCATATRGRGDKGMQIQWVEIEHRNPSLGPHERVVSYSLGIEKQKDVSDQLLDKTIINGVMSLRSYAEATKKNDTAALKKVFDKAPNEPMSTGSTISRLTFKLEDESKIAFDDLRKWTITGYYKDTFQKSLVETGHRYEPTPIRSRPFEEEERKIKPLTPEEIEERSTINKNDLPD